MIKTTIVSALGILALTGTAYPGTLDNLISSRVYNFGDRELKQLPNQAAGQIATNPPSAFGFTDKNVSLDYMYTHGNGNFGQEIDTHTINPSVYLEYDSNFSVTAGFNYFHTDEKDDSPTKIRQDGYSPWISVDEEVLHFIRGVDTGRTALFVEENFSYTRVDSTASQPMPFHVGKISMDDFDAGAGLIFIQSLMNWNDGQPGHLALTLRPGYNCMYESIEGESLSYNSSLFSFLGRLDYGITKQLYVNASATWFHYYEKQNPTLPDDWAALGGGITWKFFQNGKYTWLFTAGYSYEAFYPGFHSQTVSAHVEFHY